MVITQLIVRDAAAHGSRPGPGYAARYRHLPAVVHRCYADHTGVADLRNGRVLFLADPDPGFQVILSKIQGNGSVDSGGRACRHAHGKGIDPPAIRRGYADVAGLAVLCRRYIGTEQVGNGIIIKGIISQGKARAVFARGYLAGYVHIPVARSGFDVQLRRHHRALFHYSGNRIVRLLDADRTGPVKGAAGSGHTTGDIYQKGIGIGGYIQAVQIVFTVCHAARHNRCVGYISPEVIADQSHGSCCVSPGGLCAGRDGQGHRTDIRSPVGYVNRIDGIPVWLCRGLPVVVRDHCIIHRHAAH